MKYSLETIRRKAKTGDLFDVPTARQDNTIVLPITPEEISIRDAKKMSDWLHRTGQDQTISQASTRLKGLAIPIDGSKDYNMMNNQYWSGVKKRFDDVLNVLYNYTHGEHGEPVLPITFDGVGTNAETLLTHKNGIPLFDTPLTEVSSRPIPTLEGRSFYTLGLPAPRTPLGLPAPRTPLGLLKNPYSGYIDNFGRQRYTFVDDFGNIDEQAFTDFWNELRPNSADPYRLSHSLDVAKSAQTLPLPKGFSRKQFVETALLHDIGKNLNRTRDFNIDNADYNLWKHVSDVGFGYRGHGRAGRAMLQHVGYPLTKEQSDAIARHMDNKSFRTGQDLLKAVEYADAARGENLTEALALQPNLMSYQTEPWFNISTSRSNTDFINDIKTRVNPILTQAGLGSIDLRLPKDKIIEELNKKTARWRTLYRGVRDPLGTSMRRYENINAANAERQAIEIFGKDVFDSNPEYYRTLTTALGVPYNNTGGGRSGLLDFLRRMDANPDDYDALYASNSPDVVNQYKTGTNTNSGRLSLARRVMLPFERYSGETLPSEWMSDEFDWDLFDMSNEYGKTKDFRLDVLGGRLATPLSRFSQFDIPYRLQTGRSFLQDYIQSLGIKPGKWEHPGIIDNVYKDADIANTEFANEILSKYGIKPVDIANFRDDIYVGKYFGTYLNAHRGLNNDIQLIDELGRNSANGILHDKDVLGKLLGRGLLTPAQVAKGKYIKFDTKQLLRKAIDRYYRSIKAKFKLTPEYAFAAKDQTAMMKFILDRGIAPRVLNRNFLKHFGANTGGNPLPQGSPLHFNPNRKTNQLSIVGKRGEKVFEDAGEIDDSELKKLIKNKRVIVGKRKDFGEIIGKDITTKFVKGGRLSLETIRPKADTGNKIDLTLDDDEYYGGTLPHAVVTPDNVSFAYKPEKKELTSEQLIRNMHRATGTVAKEFALPALMGATSAPATAAFELGSRAVHSIDDRLGTAVDIAPFVGMGAGLASGTGGYKLAQGVGKGLYGLSKAGYKIATRPGWLAQHVYEAKEPFGYSLENMRIIPTLKKIFKGQNANVDNPWWFDRSTDIRTRDAAYRIWARLDQREPIYLKNADGTYSYNIDYLIDNDLFGNSANFQKYRINTGKPINFGKLLNVLPEGKTIIKDPISAGYNAGNINLTKQYGTVTLEDLWDLTPLQIINWLPKKLRNMEVSKFVGGKPFQYKQIFKSVPSMQHSEKDFLYAIRRQGLLDNYKYRLTNLDNDIENIISLGLTKSEEEAARVLKQQYRKDYVRALNDYYNELNKSPFYSNEEPSKRVYDFSNVLDSKIFNFRHGGKISLERPKAQTGGKSAVQAAMQAQRDKEEGIAGVNILPEFEVHPDNRVRIAYSSLLNPYKVRNRLVANASDYIGDDIGITPAIQSFAKYLINNDKFDESYRDNYRDIITASDTQLEARYNTLPKEVKSKLSLDNYKTSLRNEARELLAADDIKDVYLGFSPTDGTVIPSDYSPQLHGDKNKDFYKSSVVSDSSFIYKWLLPAYNNLINKNVIGEFDDKSLHKPGDLLRIGRSGNNAVTIMPILGRATIGAGEDDKGKYLSYYDDWDVELSGHSGGEDYVSKIIGGKPVQMYDRIYLNKDMQQYLDSLNSKKRDGGHISLERPRADTGKQINLNLDDDEYYGGVLPHTVITPDSEAKFAYKPEKKELTSEQLIRNMHRATGTVAKEFALPALMGATSAPATAAFELGSRAAHGIDDRLGTAVDIAPFVGMGAGLAKGAIKGARALTPLAKRPNRAATITAAQAATITDAQWDAAYNAAIKSGDMAEAQRLRDLHFMAKATPVRDRTGKLAHNYHATKAKFNSFDFSKAGTGSGNKLNTEGVAYFTPYRDASIDVFHPNGTDEYNLYNIIDAYLHNPNPVEIPLEEFVKTYHNREAFLKLRNAGDGIIARAPKTPEDYYMRDLKRYEDALASGDPWRIKFTNKPKSPKDYMEEQLVDNITINNPKHIKLADAITYDDAGNIIPLSKRDNFNINDIRYGLIPIGFGIGMGAAANQKRDGGSIHIKPSHRGRLTELKERTGKSEAELYADGSPAVRKMVTFARNARKWNHRNGGRISLETI